MNEKPLAGKVALVAGATRGITDDDQPFVVGVAVEISRAVVERHDEFF